MRWLCRGLLALVVLVGGSCLHDVDRYQLPADLSAQVDLRAADLPVVVDRALIDQAPVELSLPGLDSIVHCSDGTPSGQCSSTKPTYCEAGVLVDRCSGPDGVIGNADDCGCPAGANCLSNGTCCTPDCAGKSCGGDGCGGSCGSCSGFPCAGNTPICNNGACTACQCPNNCYNVIGYCGPQGGVLKDCYFTTPTPTDTNYCLCTVHCASGSPPDLVVGDSANPGNGGC